MSKDKVAERLCHFAVNPAATASLFEEEFPLGSGWTLNVK